jgi:hypothetical protein
MKKLIPVIGAVLLLTAFSTLNLAQKAAPSRLPFVGTRTFCGEHSYRLPDAPDNDAELKWKTKTTVTIRKNGFTTVKTNAYGPPEGTGTPSPNSTFSGKLRAGKKGEMHDTAMGVCHLGPICLTFLSATHIVVDTEESADEGELCSSDEAFPKKSNHAQRAPTVQPTVPVQTAEQGLTKVSFTRLKSRDIAKLYPALKELVLTKRDVSDVADLPAFPPTALIADVRDKATNLNLLFVYDFWCSKKTGCAFQIYADEGSGYGQVHGGSGKGPFFLLKDNGETSVVYCAYDEIDEWSYERNAWRNARGDIMRGHNFRFKGHYTGKGVPVCPK